VSDCIYLQEKDKAHFLTRKNLQEWFTAEEVSTKRKTIQEFMETMMVSIGLYIENLNLPDLSFSTNLSQYEPQVPTTTHLVTELLFIYRISQPIRRTLIFSLQILEKIC
jgi:hypothetical protein